MAIFFPDIETIKKFKVPPTAGEWALLNFIGNVLDDSYEIYFNPYLNGDRPDFIIMRKGYGVMIIEVKDWNLENFKLNENKKWIYSPNGSFVKSPIDQVLKYKNNLFDLHVDKLLEKKINNFRHFRIVSCAVYFHCASQKKIEDLLVTPYKEERKYQDFLKYNIDLIGKDGLYEDRFSTILQRRHLAKCQSSYLFTNDLYENFKRILSPTIHMKSGIPYNYSKKQKEIIYGKQENGVIKVQLEQRVRGVFGSGKTTVLAARAVQAYKRALSRNNNPRILILTYNITLKNFIHDKLMRVDETFPIENFIVINYHQFINAELNNLNVDMEIPDGYPSDEVGEYLEQYYYSNISLFEAHKTEIVKYDAVLIDEIQDYHRKWMEIIKNYFRDPKGDYVLFGDVKQNIYGQPTFQKDVVTNVQGGVKEFRECFRSELKIKDLAHLFQENIFGEKYNIDNFTDNGQYSLDLKDGYINYMFLKGDNIIPALYTIIRENILNHNNNISPNDITILGYTTNLLRMFDCYYRYASRERTNSMMETIEAMYMTNINYIGKDAASADGWFNNLSTQLAKNLYPRGTSNMIKLRQHISKLFTLYDLYSSWPYTFTNRLKEECNKRGILEDSFLEFREHYKEELTEFKTEVYQGNYKYIRDNKKLHFWFNSGTIKISTIHSFKGWESEVVFLIIEPLYDRTTHFNLAFDELLYTGLTRCKRNLVVINFENEEYDHKMRPLIERIK